MQKQKLIILARVLEPNCESNGDAWFVILLSRLGFLSIYILFGVVLRKECQKLFFTPQVGENKPHTHN